jgi:hypothetical protein
MRAALNDDAPEAAEAVDHGLLRCHGHADGAPDAERPGRIGAGEAGVAARRADEMRLVAKGLERALGKKTDASRLRAKGGRESRVLSSRFMQSRRRPGETDRVLNEPEGWAFSSLR